LANRKDVRYAKRVDTVVLLQYLINDTKTSINNTFSISMKVSATVRKKKKCSSVSSVRLWIRIMPSLCTRRNGHKLVKFFYMNITALPLQKKEEGKIQFSETLSQLHYKYWFRKKWDQTKNIQWNTQYWPLSSGHEKQQGQDGSCKQCHDYPFPWKFDRILYFCISGAHLYRLSS